MYYSIQLFHVKYVFTEVRALTSRIKFLKSKLRQFLYTIDAIGLGCAVYPFKCAASMYKNREILRHADSIGALQ